MYQGVIFIFNITMKSLLAGPTDQPRISRSTQDYSQDTLWYTGNEEGEQDLYALGERWMR